LALPAVVAGVAGMMVAAWATAALGVRPMLIASELALAAPALVALAVPRWRASLGVRPVSAVAVGLALASGGALWAASLGLLELQYAVWAPPPGYLQQFQRLHEMLRPRGPADAALSLAAISIAPAVCEELLFRGFVLQALRGPLGTAAAVALSTAFFAVIHLDFSGSGPTLYRVPFAFAVGVGFALLRLRSGSLLPAMVAHAVVNATTFGAALQEAPVTVLPDPRPWLGAALLAAGGAALAVLLPRVRPAAATSPAAPVPL
jgi:membrane protease YdiL (CAAX protease family)